MFSILLVLGSKDKGMMDKRVSLAKRVYASSHFDYVVFSGGNGEAEYMAHKWNGNKFILENRSSTTLENLLFTKEIIGDVEDLTIVTDRSHLPRTRYLSKRVFPYSRVRLIGLPVPVGFIISRFYYEFSRWIRHAFQ